MKSILFFHPSVSKLFVALSKGLCAKVLEKEKWYEVFCEIVLFPDLCCSENDVFTAHCTWGDNRVESSQT